MIHLAALVLALQAPPDLSRIRGANYIPSYASTSVKIWHDYRPDVINRELDYARRLNLNSLRVYLQYVVYEHDPAAFVERFRDFVRRCGRHGLRPLFVLFDSCFGDEPSLEKADSPTWVNNPGFSRLGPDHRAKLEAYVRAVTEPFDGSDAVLGWDVMNEPMADFNHVTRKERDLIWDFVRHFCRFTKRVDPDRPVTVGHAVAEYLPKTADLVDFLSLHSYAAPEAEFLGDLRLARRTGRDAGKPVVVTECGNPGAGQDYETVLDVLRREKSGFYFWELMIGKMQFRDTAGLLYPDGTTRHPGAVAALLGFPRATGGIPLKTPPDTSALRTLLESPDRWKGLLEKARATPRTRKGIGPFVTPLAAVGRRAARPRPEAGKIFELALSIGNLLRMEREPEAMAMYERLLELVGAEIR